ncbi:MAG: zf-HC2 domain-containing protein [Deltaproteobacteria bacterium]|nr:zf-HC2 domain-containing protein [Deltaproteobacteria bacterium]
MRCFDVQRKLPALLDDECNAATRDRIMAHLKECEICRGFFDELKGISESLETVPAPEPSESLLDRVLRRIAEDEVTEVAERIPLLRLRAFRIPAAAAAIFILSILAGAWFGTGIFSENGGNNGKYAGNGIDNGLFQWDSKEASLENVLDELAGEKEAS